MKSAGSGAAGFILVATLWLLAGLAVLAAYIDGVATSNVERARLAKQSLEFQLHRQSTEATLIYLLATGRMNHRGLILEKQQRFADRLDSELPNSGDGALTVTGEVYQGLGEVRFALQDEIGLVSVNSPRFPVFAAVLEQVGIAAADIARIVARIEDYIDVDQRLNLNGAEYFDYRQRNLPAPPNWIMASPLELKKVLGFNELVTSSHWDRLIPLLSMRQAGGYNFNTMKPEILAAVLELEPDAIRPLLQERAVRPLMSLRRIAMLTGRYLDIEPEELLSLPSRFLRITLWQEGSTTRLLVGIELTPFADDAPWRKDYQYSERIKKDDSRKSRKVATALFQ